MAWDEWEQLKSAALQRQLAHAQLGGRPATGTGPAGPAGTGRAATGGTATLRHSHGPWSRAAGALDDLHTSTGTSATELTSAHHAMASETTGLSSADVLTSVLASWERRIGDVRSECASLVPRLRQVGVGLGEVDHQVGRAVGSVIVAADTGGGE